LLLGSSDRWAELADLGDGGDHVTDHAVGEAEVAVGDIAGKPDEVAGTQVDRVAEGAGAELASEDIQMVKGSRGVSLNGAGLGLAAFQAEDESAHVSRAVDLVQ
jgi:hypothetical protein